MHITHLTQIKEKKKSQKLSVLPAFCGPLILTFLKMDVLMGDFPYGCYLYMSAELCCWLSNCEEYNLEINQLLI